MLHIALPCAEIKPFSSATASLRSIRDDDVMPDVVFTEIRMTGTDGLELAARIKMISPDIKIIFVTRYGITYYPLKIVLDETIATQIGCENTIQLENESEFKTVLGKILNSDKLKSVINSLFALNVQELQKDF